MKDEKLKLYAKNHEELLIISALLQDAIVPACDIKYIPKDNCFTLIAQRFRWDKFETEPSSFERILCLVEIRGVKQVQKLSFEKSSVCGLYELLTITLEESFLKLVFAGGAEIKLKMNKEWEIRIKDIGDPWPGAHLPFHPA